jgi:hypothetical protein
MSRVIPRLLATVVSTAMLLSVAVTSADANGHVPRVTGVSRAGADLHHAKLKVRWHAVRGATYKMRYAPTRRALVRHPKVVRTARASGTYTRRLKKNHWYYVQVRAITHGVQGAWSPVHAMRLTRARSAGVSVHHRGPHDLPGWNLSYAENFSRMSSRWNVLDGLNMSGHAEVSKTRNVSVRGGVLSMKAMKQRATASNGATKDYTSGFMFTQGKYTVPNYFRAEIRARVPWGQGLWPAPLWFRPNDQSDGEIDLVESIGRENNVMHYTIHSGGYGSSHVYSGHAQRISNPTGWHTWTVSKTRDLIVMYCDGREVARWTPSDRAWKDSAFESGKRWALWSNLQLGGSWAGNPDGSTSFSGMDSTMQIDHIYTWTQS